MHSIHVIIHFRSDRYILDQNQIVAVKTKHFAEGFVGLHMGDQKPEGKCNLEKHYPRMESV